MILAAFSRGFAGHHSFFRKGPLATPWLVVPTTIRWQNQLFGHTYRTDDPRTPLALDLRRRERRVTDSGQ